MPSWVQVQKVMRDLTQDSSPQENYLHMLFPQEPSPLFEEAREFARQIGKAPIGLSPHEARLVASLIHLAGCKKFVEIGTLTGVSALWIAEALPAGGELWTLEKDEKHAQFAKEIFAKYHHHKPGKKIHLIEGDAKLTLKSIQELAPFDGIFIDGNKAAYGIYLDWAEKNLKKGALILADNIFLGGAVVTGNKAVFSKKQIEVMKSFNERLADPKRYFSAVIPTGEGLFAAIKLF
jgi:predicted O-methyltransferase YrrM